MALSLLHVNMDDGFPMLTEQISGFVLSTQQQQHTVIKVSWVSVPQAAKGVSDQSLLQLLPTYSQEGTHPWGKAEFTNPMCISYIRKVFS